MPTLPAGTLIGVYRVEALIGSGGMGSVFRAVHSKLGRKAAIKVLADPLAADPEYVSRFFHEARIVSEVGHPNIVDVVDFIESESPKRVAYVMELVDGPTLSKVLHSNRLTREQVLNISLQLLDALQAVHRINVVHRDLKPDNILVIGSLDDDLSARPAIKVLDFGIAKIKGDDAVHKTTTGMMLGTPAYMSPEQVAGEEVSSATDVYAFGEILYEMLAGKRLFQGKGREIMKLKVGDFAPPIDLPADTPDRAAFTNMIRACLLPEQSTRPPISRLIEHLKNIQGGHPAIAPIPLPKVQPQPAPYQSTLSAVMDTAAIPGPRSKKLPLMIAGVAMLVLATIVVLLLVREPEPVFVQAVPLEDPPQEIVAPPPPPVVAPPPAPEPAPVVEAAPPPVSKKTPPKPRTEKVKPLKKGQFPTW
jgi:serine/threonine protein kinase